MATARGRGRPEGWSLLPGAPPLRAARVDRWNRVTLPLPVRTELTWLQPPGPLLGVLEPGGMFRLLPFDGAGALEDRIRNAASEDAILLERRYSRILLHSDSRIELPDHVAAHLGAFEGGVVLFRRQPTVVEVISIARNEELLAEALILAAELP